MQEKNSANTGNLICMQTNIKNENKKILNRLKESLSVQTHEELAKALNIKSGASAISEFLKTGFPKERLKQASAITGKSIVWLEYGVEATPISDIKNLKGEPLISRQSPQFEAENKDLKKTDQFPPSGTESALQKQIMNGINAQQNQIVSALKDLKFKAMKEFLAQKGLDDEFDRFYNSFRKQEESRLGV